jgi:hypothetical protein
MRNTLYYLRGMEEIDPAWVKELATYSSIINGYALSENDKKQLIRFFFNYQNEGFNSLSAMKKAIHVFDCIKS